jgi:uncharacterized protein YjbI with pentapeptide repeats
LLDSNFEGADFSNAIVDRASFTGSSLRGAIFANAVLTGTSFDDANVENVDFTDAYIGGEYNPSTADIIVCMLLSLTAALDFDIRKLCKNPTLNGENPVTGADTKLSAGCAS